MKNNILSIAILILISFSLPLFSQVKKTEKEIKNNDSLELNILPEIVIKSVRKDFSRYLPNYNNPDNTVNKIEEKLISYDLGKDYEGNEEYLVVMKLNDNMLVATYNSDGKLIRVVEEYKNVKLPTNVIYMVYKNYPGWTIVKDKFLYTQEKGNVTKKQYNIKIKKEKERVINLVVYPNENIIKKK
ncbi:MAG: hypothetical protein ABI549_10740 [Flavobacterium sp.]|uniref:hypothetical protein n=1 Tax=Flavobacterium sp. TaxID=239 RepID=UPI0032679507